MSVLKLARNFSFVLSSKIITTLLATGAMIFLIRYLGPDKYGIFAFVVTISGITGMVADFGISIYLVGEISKHKEKVNKYLSAHLAIQLFITTFCLLFLLIVAIFQENPTVSQLIIISSIGLIFSNFHIPFAAVLQGFEDMGYFITLSLISGLTTVAIIALGIYYQTSLLYFSLLTVCPGVFSFLTTLFYARRYIAFENISFDFIKKILYAGIPFGILITTSFLYSRIDIVMLKYMMGEKEVGLYSTAYKLIFFLNMIPSALSSALYPLLSNYTENAKEKVEKIITQISKYIIVITVCISFYIFFYSENLIYCLFGSVFLPSVAALQILILSFAPNAARVPITNYFMSQKKIKTLFIVVFSALILNIALNIFLIPSYSLYGAAAATMISEIIIIIVFYFLISHKYTMFIKNIKLLPLIAVFGLCFLIFYYSPALIPFAAIIIGILILSFKIIEKDELLMFSKILKHFFRKK